MYCLTERITQDRDGQDNGFVFIAAVNMATRRNSSCSHLGPYHYRGATLEFALLPGPRIIALS
jgi:hypothetical protein